MPQIKKDYLRKKNRPDILLSRNKAATTFWWGTLKMTAETLAYQNIMKRINNYWD